MVNKFLYFKLLTVLKINVFTILNFFTELKAF